jgi:hypothetical protein
MKFIFGRREIVSFTLGMELCHLNHASKQLLFRLELGFSEYFLLADWRRAAFFLRSIA